MSHTPQEKLRTKPLTPLSTGQMSSSLKERLKRSGRYHTSTPAKKLCLDRQTIDSSPVFATSDSELSKMSQKRLQVAQKDSSPSLCNAQKTSQSLNTNLPKSCIGDVVPSFQSPATRLFSRSPFSTNFVSPTNTAISGTPLSSKRKGRLVSRSARLNFSQDGLKTKDDLCPKLDLSAEEKSSSGFSCDTDLHGALQLVAENKQEISSPRFISEKEQKISSPKIPVKSRVLEKTVALENQKLVSMKRSLLQEIKVQEESLRKLKMVKMYRSKNNLSHLQLLIDKWRDLSQQSLQDLLQLLPEPKPSMTELLQHLQIEKHLVNFDSTEEIFS